MTVQTVRATRPEPDPAQLVSPASPSQQVAIVGSPSSNSELTLNLTAEAYESGLVGALVYVQPGMGEGEELALGTVTQVLTTNQWHENPSLLGVVKSVGLIPGLTTDGDIRTADVKLQATYNRTARSHGEWSKSGPSLSMSPPTGTPVRRVSNEVIGGLLTESERAGLAYLGTVYRNESVVLPTNMRDFADDRGAIHTGIFGTTGSGRSAMACLILGCQLRHDRLGVLVIDPQGQFSSDAKTILPLQSVAATLGRQVESLRIAHDIRLSKDPRLLCSMLATTEFFARLEADHEVTVEKTSRVIRDFLEDRNGDWTEQPAQQVLREILDKLDNDETIKSLIRSADRRAEIRAAVQRSKDGVAWKRLLRTWEPLHSLFSPKNLLGGRRRTLWSVLKDVLTPGAAVPRPYIVIDMSAQAGQESGYDFGLLDDEGLKARLLRMIVGTVNAVAEKHYKEEKPLNALVMFDEAHRYAPPIRSELPQEIRELSGLLARCARETRKYGIGWTYITQTIGGINQSIFDMLGVRVCGYGLGGSDLRAMENHIDSRDSLDLYRTFANPEQTDRYPYMVAGPFSPLSFTKAPLFVTTFRPEEWVRSNASWIGEQAQHYRTSVATPITLESLRSMTRLRSGPHRTARAANDDARSDEPANRETPTEDRAHQPSRPRVRSSLQLPLLGDDDGEG